MRLLAVILASGTITLALWSPAAAQDDGLTMQYWRIRNDLVHDFMVSTGNVPGGSCIGYRRVSPHEQVLKFGDNTAKLGIWISTLAMEHALLERSGQSPAQALEDLHQALSAINRLDLAAEPYFTGRDGQPGTAALNGFYLRDDVDTLSAPALRLLNTRNDIAPVTGIASDYLKFRETQLGNMPSQDQMIYLMMGLVFVIKLVPPDAIVLDSGIPRAFADGECSIRTEARRILDRLKRYMNPEGWDWRLYNPVTGKPIPPADGGNALALSWGFHETWRHWTEGPERFMPRSIAWKRLFLRFRSESFLRPVRNGGEGDKVLTLAAISPAWGPDAMSSLLSLCMDPEGIYDFPHIPLVHLILFDRQFSPEIADSLGNAMSRLLSALPCYENPYNYGNHWDGHGRQGFGIREWSSNYRVIEPEGRGDTEPRHWNGYFSGFDWLFYHNLYCLTLGETGGFRRPDILTGPCINTTAVRAMIGGTSLLVRDYQNHGDYTAYSSGPADTLLLAGLCPENPPSFLNASGAVFRLSATPSSTLYFGLGPGSRLVIESGSVFVLGAGVHMHIDRTASVTIQPGAIVRIAEDAELTGNTAGLDGWIW